MGKIEIDHTGTGSGITLSSDGTSLLLDGTAVGGGGADLYAANESSPSAQPSATGANSVAIGDSAVSSGADSFAIGDNADATSAGAIAIGTSAQSTYFNTVAIGESSSASGNRSMALGRTASASADLSTAIGLNSSVQGSVTATGAGAMALGGSRATGVDSFAAAVANNTTSYGASGANSVAIGKQAKSTGNNNVAIGQAQSLGSDYAIAIGYQAKTTNHSSIAIGREAGASGLGDESVAIGFGTYASGGSAIALGRNCRATGSDSVAIGSYANTNGIQGKFAFSVDYMNSTGDAQQGKYILHHSTTDATPRAVTSTGSSPSTGNQVNLRDNSAYTFSGTIVGREKASEGTDVGSWEIKGIIRREANAGTTVLVNSVINEIFVPTGWAVAITADTTNGCLKVEVTGVASTNIRWVAIVNTAEVYYP